MKNSNVGATHTGAFREWKEDFETVEIFLPLPPATCKRELVCVITPDSLNIRHTRQASLLVAQPLAGPVIPEESTWWLEGGVLNLVLAKQWRGETKSDQYWGAQLAAKGGTYECYMPPAQVRAAKQAREREEAELAQERREAAKVARAAEAAEAEAEAARRRDAQAAALQAARRRRAAGQPGDDAHRSAGLRDGEARKPRPRAQSGMNWRLFAVVFTVVLGFQLRNLWKRGVFGIIFGEGAAAEASHSHWVDEEDVESSA